MKKKTKKTVKKSVKAVKKVAKKAPAKKATKKVVKPAVKKVAKPIKRVSEQETILAQPATDESGMVMMRSVDEQEDDDQDEGVVLIPIYDNGVLTMVPAESDEE